MQPSARVQRYARFVSSRARVYVTVVAACIAAAGIAAGVAWTGRGETTPAVQIETGPREGNPPLALDFLVRDRNEAVALQNAVRLYQNGDTNQALSRFEQVLRDDPESLYAAVGAAFSRFPDGTVADLQDLARTHPASALVQLHLGLARYWLRQNAEATSAWKKAEAVEPDSAAAIRAESLLHPEMPEGRPYFVPSSTVAKDIAGMLPLQQLAALERRATSSGDAEAWILYGTALQRAGRPVSAAEAFDRAVEIEPDNVEAQTGAALARFTKDDPSKAFSKLGPLSKAHPDAAVIRFHLGLALLWLRDVADSKTQLEAAVKDEPGSVYAREAALLLNRLNEAQAGGASTAG